MAAKPMAQVVQHLRRVAMLHAGESLSDAVLLRAFVGQRDGASFEALMCRHGPMVMGVCRRILGNSHDADDAFQATFLVLVRKAASIQRRETVGNWLYGVAYRTALQARRANARRGAMEKQVVNMRHPQVNPGESWPELAEVLDRELTSLPEKYRLPVVLCDLQGGTRKHVASQLRIPEGTLSNRLATARKVLARRLARHGFGLSSTALAALIEQNGATAAVPLSVVGSTVKVATSLTAAEVAISGLVSIKVAALTEGVLKTMLLTKIKSAIAVFLVLGITALGASRLISTTLATEPAVGMNDAHEQGQAKPDNLHECVVELKQQLQQMQQKIARLEQETQPKRNETNSSNAAVLAKLFKYRVPFETGFTESKEGGRIEIREVWGTRPRIEVGGQYLVRGKYALPPGERGKLYFYETATGDWSQTTATLDLQATALDKQQGEFTLVHGMAGPGYFHLYLAPAENYSRTFANVYFGTGDNVWRRKP